MGQVLTLISSTLTIGPATSAGSSAFSLLLDPLPAESAVVVVVVVGELAASVFATLAAVFAEATRRAMMQHRRREKGGCCCLELDATNITPTLYIDGYRPMYDRRDLYNSQSPRSRAPPNSQ